MAVISDRDRVEKYKNKLTGDLLSQRVAILKEEMVRKVTMRFAEAVRIEDSVKAILDDAGISTLLYPFYLAAGRQLFAAKRRFSGASLINKANTIIQRWLADGFTEPILNRIRDTVFAIPPTPSP